MAALVFAVPAAQAAFPGANGKIVFSSTRDDPNPTTCTACNWEIYSVNADGSGLTRLTSDPAQDVLPRWSPDGRRIVFRSNRDGNREIYAMNANGSGQTRLTTDLASDNAPAWSPDGTRIAFERDDGFGGSCDLTCLVVMNADGSNATAIVPGYTGQFVPGFDWSGDAKMLAYINFKCGAFPDGIRRINSDGTGDVYLNCADDAGGPAWSPDGRELAWVYRSFARCEDYSVAVIDASDGSNLRLLAECPVVDPSCCRLQASPRWSPDSAQIAFWDEEALVVVDRDGSDPQVVADTGSSGFELWVDTPRWGLTWSPDGSQLAFVSQDRDIAIVNRDGSGQANVTDDAALDATPDWQPLRALDPYPRPGGGSPLITYLVPAYEQCTAPNSEHVAPLSQGSCTPPLQVSDLLTTSKIGQGKGFVRLDVTPGNPATTADEADVRIEAEISDVRNASDQSDYAGQVLVSSTLRISDRASGYGGVSATVSDFRFDVPVTCTPSAPAPNGSDCQILTTADTLVPGMVPEGKRSVVSSFNFNVLDAGLDGDVTPASGCPPTCGTGDEQVYLTQGVFTP